jgi:hypothetical protein
MFKLLPALLLLMTAAARADLMDITASERGWVCTPADSSFCSPGNNGADPGNNYVTELAQGISGNPDVKFRNWFEFAIPTLTGSLVSATLSLDDPQHLGGNFTYAVYGLSAQPLAFSDVTTTNPFGSIGTTAASTGTTLTIALDAAALAAIVADQGGNLFIGGIDSAENANPSGVLGDFLSSGATSHSVLNLTTSAPAVPEPSSWVLLGTLIALLTQSLRRRRA